MLSTVSASYIVDVITIQLIIRDDSAILKSHPIVLLILTKGQPQKGQTVSPI